MTLWFTHSFSRTHLLHHKKHCKKDHKAQTLTAAEQPIWEITLNPFIKTCPGMVTWQSLIPASSFAASIFHRCSLVSSNFRIFFKWFSFCQLGIVQGEQLGELSQMDQSKMLASLIWIRLDCVSLALRLAHPLFSSPVDFHPPPYTSLIPFVPAMSSLCSHLLPSQHLLPRLTPFKGKQWDRVTCSRNRKI